MVFSFPLFWSSSGYGTHELCGRKTMQFCSVKPRFGHQNHQRYKCRSGTYPSYFCFCSGHYYRTKPFGDMEKHVNPTTILTVLSAFCLSLVGLRIWHTQSNFYLFLAWNLFLAWIPYFTSLWLQNELKIFNLVLLLIWLGFLPNAPYIITDLFHLGHAKGIPYWFDTFMLFSFSITGLLLGAYSMIKVYIFFKTRIGTSLSKLLLFFISGLSAFGVYIGRYQRWNSWDLINRPKTLLFDCIQLIKKESFEISIFCWVMGCIIYFSYYLLQLNHSKSNT